MVSYLRFLIGGQHYAIPIAYISEVLQLVQVTPVPDQPDEQLGVMTLRGKIIPVIDLRRRFKVASQQLSLSTPLIAVQYGEQAAALVVDQVEGVIVLAETQRQAHPEPIIDSIARVGESIVLLLSLEHLIGGNRAYAVQ